MECGQPLHAFDLAGSAAGKSSFATAAAGRELEAIDHKNVRRSAPSMCVIADARRAVAIGGVMGGASTRGHAANNRGAGRGGRVRPDVDPHHRPALESAQRFVVPLRAQARSRGGRLGQPPLLPTDPGTGRRGAGRGRDRRRQHARRRGRRSCCASAIPGSWASTVARRRACGESSRRWASWKSKRRRANTRDRRRPVGGAT